MTDRYEKWREKAEKHDLNHTTVKRNGQKDFSCTICHQPLEIMRKEFKRFWKWYREEIPEVRSYSGKTETYDKKEDEEIITIYVNKDGIFRVTGSGKEIKIRVDTEDFGNKLSGKEVTELCNKTEEEMEPVFEEIDKIIRELWEEKEETTLLEELKNNTEETYNKKGKDRETYEDEITEFEDPVENIINMGDV